MSTDRTDRLREFTFTLEYDPEEDPVVDTFYDCADLVASSVDVYVGERSFVRLVRLTGPPEAVDRLQTKLEDREYLPRAVGIDRCCGESSAFRVECSPRQRLIYVYVEDVGECACVHSVVAAHVERGTICESHQWGGSERWRLLLRTDEAVGEIHDDLEGAFREGVRFEMGHIGEATTWLGDGMVDAALSGAKRQAITEAAAHGYYERPRGITLEELATVLEVPESTLSYRLRMAESALVEGYLERYDGDDETPPA